MFSKKLKYMIPYIVIYVNGTTKTFILGAFDEKSQIRYYHPHTVWDLELLYYRSNSHRNT